MSSDCAAPSAKRWTASPTAVTTIFVLSPAIPVKIQCFSSRQRQAAGLVGRSGAQPERMSFACGHGFNRLAVEAIGRIVAGIGEPQVSGLWIKHAEEQRHEHHPGIVLT